MSKLLASNGKPSNLTPEQYKLVRTTEFKAWFGDWENSPETSSKVVDENGEPLIMYHGTLYNFNIFDKEKWGYNTFSNIRGFFFSNGKKEAESYMEENVIFGGTRNKKGFLIECFLNLKEPIIQNIWDEDEPSLYIDNQIHLIKYNKGNGLIVENKDKNWVTSVVFEPNQIKLADGSNTTFDGNNPDIRYAKGGDTKNKIMEKQMHIQFDETYAKGGVTFSQFIKDDYWQEQFDAWMQDGNVSKKADGTYSTQDAQYRNSLKGMSELKKYFYNEFIKGQYSSYFADGGGVENIKKYKNYQEFVKDNIGSKNFVINVGSGGVTQPLSGATEESIGKQFRSLIFHYFLDSEFYYNYASSQEIKDEYRSFVNRYYNLLIDSPKEFALFWKKMKKSNDYDTLYEIGNGTHVLDIFNKYKNEMSPQLKQEFISYRKKYADGGVIDPNSNEVQFIKYKDEEIMYEPHFKEYYVNDSMFHSLEEAKQFIDGGAPMSLEIKEAYRKGLFKKGGEAGKDIYDFDKKMALINLGQVYEYAIKIDKMIKENTDLEEWVKMKLTRVEQNIADVKHSLEGWEKYKSGGEIAKKQLLHIAKYSKDLIEMIEGGSKLMSWQENKLAVSSDSIDNIYHHLDYKMGNRAEDLDVNNEYARGGRPRTKSKEKVLNVRSRGGFTLDDFNPKLNLYDKIVSYKKVGELELNQISEKKYVEDTFEFKTEKDRDYWYDILTEEQENYFTIKNKKKYVNYILEWHDPYSEKAEEEGITKKSEMLDYFFEEIDYELRLNTSREDFIKTLDLQTKFEDGGDSEGYADGGVVEYETKRIVNEAKNQKKNTHFAIHKPTNSIVFTWDFSGYDTKEMNENKEHYFYYDVKDIVSGNVDKYVKSDYAIVQRKDLEKRGIDLNNYLVFMGQKYDRSESNSDSDSGKTGFNDEGTSMVLYHEKNGNFLVPKGQVYLWLYDNEGSSEKLQNEEYDWVFYPYASQNMAWASDFIPPLKRIWTKKFQKDHKGSEHLLGVIKAYLIEENGKKELFIDMMSVNPTKMKKGIMSYMIKELRDTFKLKQDQVTFSDLTEEGKKFVEKKTYADGGGVGDSFLHLYKLTYPDGFYIVESYDGYYMTPKEALEKMRINVKNFKSYKYKGISSQNPKYKEWNDTKDIGYSNTEAWDEVFENDKYSDGGGIGEFPPKGELTNKDNFLLKYEKKGSDYEFFVYKPITKEISGYNQINHVCLNKDCPQKMNYEQFINYLYAELYLDDTQYAGGGRTMKNRAKKQAIKDIKSNLWRPQAPYQSVEKPSEEWEKYELPYDTKLQYDFEPDSFSVQGKRYSEYAKGGEIYVHKYNPNITLEFIENTNKGIKGLQKNPKSLSKKERKEGIIVNYSDSELKELFTKKYADGGKVLASSSSKDGINKLIEQYLYGSTITLVQTDNDKIYEVHNKKGKTSFYVEFSRGKYKFIQPSMFADGGEVGNIKIGDKVYGRWNNTNNWTSGIFKGETENGFEVYDFSIEKPDHIEYYAEISEDGYGGSKIYTSTKFKDRNYKNYHFSPFKDEYADGGVVIYKEIDLNRRDGKTKIVQVTTVDSYREALERIEELKKNNKNPNVTFFTGNIYADGGLTRYEIEDKIAGLKLRIAKTKKQISGYETTQRGKYNNLFQEKVVPLQKELDTLSDLYGKSKYARGGFMYEVQKKGSPSNDMRETMFTAKNLTELKKKIIEKYGTSEGFLVSRRTEQGHYVPVKFENGGEASEYQIIDKKTEKYYSVSISDGKIKWNDSPDMGYMFSLSDANQIIESLHKIGYEQVEVVKYDSNWWRKSKYEKGGAIYPDLSLQKSDVVNDSLELNEFTIKKMKNTFKINGMENTKIIKSIDAVNILRELFSEDTISAYEQAFVLYLNKNNKVIGYYHHSSGGVDGTIMDVQMISGMALKSLAKGVIIAHNHPSENTMPSDADIRISKQLKEALKLFNIQLLDSIILTDNSYKSFADEGLLF